MGLSIGFCLHKWSKVQEDGYQYCDTCNKAKLAPIKNCSHKWERKDIFNVTNFGTTEKKIFLYECENCGEPKQEVISQ